MKAISKLRIGAGGDGREVQCTCKKREVRREGESEGIRREEGTRKDGRREATDQGCWQCTQNTPTHALVQTH